jgi:aspartate racemase
VIILKLLGLIGGMSWENTIEYYRIINELIKEKLGSWNSAKLILYSVNFEEILSLENKDRWSEIVLIMTNISRNLENAGCEALMLCSNTMHKIADDLQNNISIPIINVVDETALIIKELKLKKVGLLGTKFTMEGDFYSKKLEEKYNISVIIPGKEDRDYIHSVIYNELAQNNLFDTTKQSLLRIIDKLKSQGAEGIILGCTEIPLLIKPEDLELPLFDTLKIHLNAAAQFILKAEITNF